MKKSKVMRKNKKGFTLIEVVVALAVVGIISSLIMPLVATAMYTFNTSWSLRSAAAAASSTAAVSTSQDGGKAGSQKMDVNVKIFVKENGQSKTLLGYSTFTFKTGTSTDKTQGITVKYYDLKYKDVYTDSETGRS